MKKLCMMLAAVAVFLPLPQAFSMPIENVQVQVIDENQGTSDALIEKMNSSMQIVAEQLLIDKDSESVKTMTADYEKLFSDIGDRVFTGYELQRVTLWPGKDAMVKMYIKPWSTTISDVKIDFQFSGMEQNTAAMLKQRLPNLENELRQIMEGASADAVDWAGSILRKRVRNKIEDALPEFKAAVDLVQGKSANQATIQVVVYPIGQSVRTINYFLHSETIPNIILMQLKYRYGARCNELRGLPVDYLKNHKEELEAILEKELRQEELLKNFALAPRVNIAPATDTFVDISLSTDKYKIWVEGYADLGRKKENISGRVHVGKYISPRDEIFVEEELVTDDIHWSTSLGYAHDWGKSTWSYRRRIPEADNAYKLEYRFNPKWRMRMEHYSGSNRNEYALRYRIHEFLSCEYVYGGKESYFRVIGNL